MQYGSDTYYCILLHAFFFHSKQTVFVCNCIWYAMNVSLRCCLTFTSWLVPSSCLWRTTLLSILIPTLTCSYQSMFWKSNTKVCFENCPDLLITKYVRKLCSYQSMLENYHGLFVLKCDLLISGIWPPRRLGTSENFLTSWALRIGFFQDALLVFSAQ